MKLFNTSDEYTLPDTVWYTPTKWTVDKTY